MKYKLSLYHAVYFSVWITSVRQHGNKQIKVFTCIIGKTWIHGEHYKTSVLATAGTVLIVSCYCEHCLDLNHTGSRTYGVLVTRTLWLNWFKQVSLLLLRQDQKHQQFPCGSPPPAVEVQQWVRLLLWTLKTPKSVTCIDLHDFNILASSHLIKTVCPSGDN